jgi:hypothetical protein
MFINRISLAAIFVTLLLYLLLLFFEESSLCRIFVSEGRVLFQSRERPVRVLRSLRYVAFGWSTSRWEGGMLMYWVLRKQLHTQHLDTSTYSSPILRSPKHRCRCVAALLQTYRCFHTKKIAFSVCTYIVLLVLRTTLCVQVLLVDKRSQPNISTDVFSMYVALFARFKNTINLANFLNL